MSMRNATAYIVCNMRARYGVTGVMIASYGEWCGGMCVCVLCGEDSEQMIVRSKVGCGRCNIAKAQICNYLLHFFGENYFLLSLKLPECIN